MRLSAIVLICVVLFVSVFFSGCAQQADVGLKFEPGDKSAYKVTHSSGKSYRFEQPSQDKVKDKNTDRRLEMVLSQKVDRVIEDGAAIVDVTVEEVKYYFKGPEGVQQDFDSTVPTKRTGEFARIAGKSYRIKLNKDGRAEVINSSEVSGACKGQFCSWVFNKENIAERHSITALPKDKTVVKTGDSWTEVVGSPGSMLQAKTYEKVYTLEKVYQEGGSKLAVISMKALPTSKQPEEQTSSQQGAMGFFSKMFDSQDVYTGKIIMNLDTGRVKKYHEKLDAEWVATEQSSGGDGMDVLKMGYTDSFTMKLLKR